MEAFILIIMTTTFLFPSSAATTSPATPSFILTSCGSTTYPSLCAESLAAYAPLIRRSPRQLAHLALTVSATRAREASAYVSRLSSRTTKDAASSSSFGDCVTTMNDGADKLRRALWQFRHLGRAGRRAFADRLGNVQTWVSAAITDQSMCLLSLVEDGGSNGSGGETMRSSMRTKVAEVNRVTSNALALVNRLGARN